MNNLENRNGFERDTVIADQRPHLPPFIKNKSLDFTVFSRTSYRTRQSGSYFDEHLET
jgi:hypothetical protein